MSVTSEPEFVAQTLAWCNDRRAEQGEESLDHLPKGKRIDGGSCPCGRACGLWVGALFYGERAGELDKPLPKPVRRFVIAFDHGDLPQYDEEVAA